MKSECREIILEVLTMCSYDNDGDLINMSSDVAKNIVANELESAIKKKFHMFKINKLLTDDE